MCNCVAHNVQLIAHYVQLFQHIMYSGVSLLCAAEVAHNVYLSCTLCAGYIVAAAHNVLLFK